jgi:hypothetical protein
MWHPRRFGRRTLKDAVKKKKGGPEIAPALWFIRHIRKINFTWQSLLFEAPLP